MASKRKGIFFYLTVWEATIWSMLFAKSMFFSHFPRTAFLTSPLNFNNGKNQTPPLRQLNSRAWKSGGPFGIPFNLESEHLKLQWTTLLILLPLVSLSVKWEWHYIMVHHKVYLRVKYQITYMKTLFVNYKAISNMKTWL